jgi:hypothetical protein
MSRNLPEFQGLDAAGNPIWYERAERGLWRVLRILDKFRADIDYYRAEWGKEIGEELFFEQEQPYETSYQHGNILLVGGVASIWQMAIGNGSATPGNALCYINNANATIGVGDSSTTEVYTQQDLVAATNKFYQGMDASYPLTTDVVLPGQTTVKTITAASNATPISVTSTSHGFATGDVIYIANVAGNTATNGLWQITVVDANTFTLNGSTGNGAYTSGGSATKSNVIVFKATIGPANANFVWNEWVIKNGTGGSSRGFNRKVSSLGTKSSGTWALTAGIAIA